LIPRLKGKEPPVGGKHVMRALEVGCPLPERAPGLEMHAPVTGARVARSGLESLQGLSGGGETSEGPGARAVVRKSGLTERP